MIWFQINGQSKIFSISDSWSIDYLHGIKGNIVPNLTQKKTQIDYDLNVSIETLKFLKDSTGEKPSNFDTEKDCFNRAQKHYHEDW